MKTIQLSILLATLASCTVSNVTTTNLHNLAAFEENSKLYALPQTKLKLEIIATRSEFSPGPFHVYAEKYLGIKNVQAFSDVKWELSDIKIASSVFPDPDQYFSVCCKDNRILLENINHLKEDGLLLVPEDLSELGFNNSNIKSQENDVLITDLSIRRFYKENSKKNYNNVIRDSINYKIPASRKQLIPKTLEEKANEAANFIFKIRKRRFKLIAGQYEVYPEEMALATSVKELNKLEENYLSLFVGSISVDTIRKIYSVTPNNIDLVQRFTLFRFTDENGFYASEDSKGTPVLVELQSINNNRLIKQLAIPGENSNYNNLLIYRIPDQTNIKVWFGSHVILEADIPVFQLGPMVPYNLPENRKKLFRYNW